MGIPKNFVLPLPGSDEPAELADVLQAVMTVLKRAMRKGEHERQGAYLIGPLRLTAVLTELGYRPSDVRNLSAVLQRADLAVKTRQRDKGVIVWGIRAIKDVRDADPPLIIESFVRDARTEEELRDDNRELRVEVERLRAAAVSQETIDLAFVEELKALAGVIVAERDEALRSLAATRGENTKLRQEVVRLDKRVQALSRDDREITRQAALQQLRDIISPPAEDPEPASQ